MSRESTIVSIWKHRKRSEGGEGGNNQDESMLISPKDVTKRKKKERKQLTSDEVMRRIVMSQGRCGQERSVQRRDECRWRKEKSTAAFELLQQCLGTLRVTRQQHTADVHMNVRRRKCQTKGLSEGSRLAPACDRQHDVQCSQGLSNFTQFDAWSPKLWRKKQAIRNPRPLPQTPYQL